MRSEKIEVILVDIGNSAIKSAEVVAGKIGDSMKWATLEELNSYYSSDHEFMLCSTRKMDETSLEGRSVTILSHLLPLPIALAYDTPETLGADRIAAAAGANALFPKHNNLIIDLGTCVTLDLIDKHGVFRGGIISPGLKMRMKAMAHFTSQLPDISEEWTQFSSGLLGSSTKQCLLSGSFGGLKLEIQGVIDDLKKNFTSLNVIMTGGDVHYFESSIKAHIFAGSKIVQTGLYRIWKYQNT